MLVPNPKRILVIIMARIGDTLMITPAISSLKKTFPDAVIDVVAHHKRMCVLENNPDIHSLYCSRWLEHFRRLLFNRTTYDIVFIYARESRLIKYGRSRGKLVVGFEQQDARLNKLFDICVKKPDFSPHAVDERLLLVKAIGLESFDKKLVYVISKKEKEWAESFIRNNNLQKIKIKIGFQVAGFPTKAYRDWPAEHFITLGQYILKELGGNILLFGDKKDHKKALHIQSALRDNALIVAGKTTLRQAAALLSHCNAVVTTDTGPMHISFALKVPTVALFHCMHSGQSLGPTADAQVHRILQMVPPQGKPVTENLEWIPYYRKLSI